MSKSSINWKRALGESPSITASRNWFMVFAGKAAEPVLVVSVLYASVKRLPVVHFPPQFDGAVFIAHFVTLDIGGLSLNTLAEQAKKDGNDEGALNHRSSVPEAGNGGPLEIDKVIWPLLNTGLSVRQVAAKAQTSTATVGRSWQRWEKAKQSVSAFETERDAKTDERAL